MSGDELTWEEREALAREEGGALCFLSDNPDTADLAVISLWWADTLGIVLLRLQNEYTDFSIRLRASDLAWLLTEGPQTPRD